MIMYYEVVDRISGEVGAICPVMVRWKMRINEQTEIYPKSLLADGKLGRGDEMLK